MAFSSSGEKLEEVVRKAAPKACFEMGCYIGCSALAVGKTLPAGGRLITTEPNQKLASIAREIIEFAGLDQVSYNEHLRKQCR